MVDSPPATFEALMAEIYDIPLDRHNRYRSNFVYRGFDVATWGLETSLQRLGPHYSTVEKSLLRNFIKYSTDRDLSSQTLLYKLAFAQHHGLPTRVLDWTTAPKVALHFAVGDEQHFDEDGMIWAVDVTEMRKCLPRKPLSTLDAHKAFVFSVEMLSDLKDLDDFEQMACADDFVIFFEPPSLDTRIVNQAAILSAATSAKLDLKAFLLRYPKAIKQLVIRKELKWELRDKLDQDSVNERMLFPGEDGTARWLKRYYSQGSSKGATGTAPPGFSGAMTGTGS